MGKIPNKAKIEQTGRVASKLCKNRNIYFEFYVKESLILIYYVTPWIVSLYKSQMYFHLKSRLINIVHI